MQKTSSRQQLFANSYRNETVNNREYIVTSGVIVQEQVMNTYLVPAEELAFADMWNGTAITVRHPKLNNGSANVPQPDVAVIGRFFNASWDGDNNRVVGEYWIDINDAMQYVEGQYIINAIYNGQVLETSTGYWATEEFTEGEFNGKPYKTIQHNLKPDHIAILVDEIGACSVLDGCGVNRNSLLHSLYSNTIQLNGGPGSGFWGHLGRPGQVGGAAPSGTGSKVQKRPVEKKLKKSIKAYYVAGKSEAERKNKSGFKSRVSLMSKAKAAALYKRMSEGNREAAILEVSLKAGTPYEKLTATSITLKSVDAGDIKIITFDTLDKKKLDSFTNAADCDCNDVKAVVDNEESITQRVDSLRKFFYEQYNEQDMMYSVYVRDYFEDYIIVEMGQRLFKVSYTHTANGFTFAKPEDWKAVTQEYVEQNMIANVLGDLPARAKKIWEKVYQAWLDGHPDDEKGAAKRAWGAVKQAGWKQLDGKWVKKNSIVKGVETTNVRSKNGKHSIWTVRNSKTKHSKETNMKLKLGDVLTALRKKGVAINTEDDEEFDEDGVLELEAGGEDEEEVEPVQNNTPQPLFSEQEVAGLKKLAKLDFTPLLKLAEQAPVMLEVAQNASAERDAKKKQLIANIVSNSSSPFTTEELEAMPLPVLTKMEAQYNMDFSGLGGGYTMAVNEDDDDVLGVDPIVLAPIEEK